MKIRTDFVTNSSSSSFIAFTIESRLFAQIIAKHKSVLRDLFSGENSFVYEKEEITDDTVIIEATDLCGGPCDYIPKKRSEFISAIARLLSDGEISDESQLENGAQNDATLGLLTELFANAQDITNSIESIEWTVSDGYYGEYGNREITKKFCSYAENDETYAEDEESYDEDEEFYD